MVEALWSYFSENIWGSTSGVTEDEHFLGCYTVSIGKMLPTFRSIIPCVFSGLRSPRKLEWIFATLVTIYHSSRRNILVELSLKDI